MLDHSRGGCAGGDRDRWGSFASASNNGGGRTIVVIEKTTSQHFLDLGTPGPSAGDEFVFASQFWNTDQTRQVGSNRGY